MTDQVPEVPAPAPAGATLDDVLAGVNKLTAVLTPASSPSPAPSSPSPRPRGIAGAGMAVPPPPPPPPPPPADPTPHADETGTFAPGEVVYHQWTDPRDPAGKPRVQAVAVVAQDDDHVHGLVLGDAGQLASFAHGTLTHDYPAAG